MRWPISVKYEPQPYLQRLFAPLIRPIVVTSIRLRNLIDSEDGEPDCLLAVLEFNESETNPEYPDHIDLNQLRSSLFQNGNFHIWTCSCGAPDCAGLINGVDVTHSKGTTKWHDLDRKRRFVVNTKDLRDSYDHAIIEGRNLLLQRPKLEVAPEQNESAYCNDG